MAETSMPYAPIVKHDGPAALRDLDRIDPDAMIVDFAMAGMNGAEGAQKARSIRPDLPIILASGYSKTQALTAISRARTRLLRKPFKVIELQSALADLLA